MGTGHLARCRVLADACLRRGWSVRWMTAFPEGRKFAPKGRAVKIISIPVGARGRIHARIIGRLVSPRSIVVLDGYHFGFRLEKELRRLELKVVAIDDNARRLFASNVVLNGNIHARELRYRRARGTRLALGPKYFIFSEEVRKARRRITPRDVRKILVTMGGADPSNQALKVLKGIEKAGLSQVSVLVIAGAANRRFAELRRFARQVSFRCRVVRATPRIGAEMATADFGIGSAGRIATEMAFLGLPGLRIVLAANQWGLIRKIHREGAAINLGWHWKLTPGTIARRLRDLMDDVALRRRMSDKGRALFDGKGTERVVRIFEKLST